MKYIYLTLLSALILVSCGGDGKQSVSDIIATGNLEKIKTKKAEIEKTQLTIANELQLLNNEISKLDDSQRLSQITTFKTKAEVFKHYIELQGNVTTKQNVVIFPEYNGVLSKVYVKEGQQVSKGQLLAKIDDGGLSQQLAQMKIQTELAKTTYERQKRLWDQKIGSEIQFLQAQSSYQAQEKAVQQMESQLAKTNVRAPFSGTIDDVLTDQGSVVGAGQSQLFRIVNLNNMYIETAVPEAYITNVTKDKHVLVDFPVLNKTFDAKIRQAGNFINAANRTFKIEVAVPNKEKAIKPNLTAKLKINDYTSENAILIPQSVISENAEGDQYVYTIENKNSENIAITKRIIIETGKAQGDVIEILTGIEPGMEIVDEGARSVKESQKVEIINQ